MQRIGRRLHPATEIEWRLDRLPELTETRASGETFDLIVLSAVWMHVKPTERRRALENLAAVLKPGGIMYLTLRIGPAEPARGIYSVSAEELHNLVEQLGFQAEALSEQTDLLGRSNIRWIALSIFAP
jgi:2-polyprenyl-3-methyl-5-hydroxy-6-metoxy-1,4-benzoquinol methylase